MKRNIIFIILLIILSCGALFFGSVAINPFDVYEIYSRGSGDPFYAILFELRMPRVFLAVMVGASLAVSGTLFQAILRNPLADPYLIGVSSGAALGATLGVATSLGSLGVSAASFCGALTAVFLVFILSERFNIGGAGLILAGVAISFVFSSMVFLIYSFALPGQVHRAVMWMMGDLSAARYELLLPMAPAAILLGVIALMCAKRLDIISFGDRLYSSSGIGRGSLAVVYWTASLLAALSVALCGVVGFIGLVAPHIMRRIVGPGHGALIPAAAFAGAVFLLLSDVLSRTLVPPYEIPVGVVSGFAGGLFFLIFMIRRRV